MIDRAAGGSSRTDPPKLASGDPEVASMEGKLSHHVTVGADHYDRAARMDDLKQLFSDLIRYETELWNVVDARLRAEHDLPLHRFEPMQIIARTPDCRVYDIADALSLTTGGVSKLVDSIESAGYVKRRPNPEDRRSSIIELTSTGRKALARATTTFEAELQLRLGADVSDRALRQFAATLNALRAANAGADAAHAA
jgi:DNA-binding MarR family transcriptional regulator